MDIKIWVKTSAGEDWEATDTSLTPVYLEGCEEVNRPNEFRVLARGDVESSDNDFPIWVGDRVKIEVADNEKGPEFQKTLHLLVVAVEDIHFGSNLDNDKNEWFSRLTFVSEIWRLGLNHGYRVFEDMDVPTIFETIVPEVFNSDPNSRGEVLTHHKREYQSRPHCIQYDETSLEFIDRILRDEGLSYIVDNTGETEKVYLFDANTPLQQEIAAWREVSRNRDLGLLRHQRMMPDLVTVDTVDSRAPNSDTGLANIGAETNVNEEDAANGVTPRRQGRGNRANFNGQWRLFECGLSNRFGDEYGDLSGHDDITREHARLRNAQINHARSSVICEIEEMNISPGCSMVDINSSSALTSKIFITGCHFIVYNQIQAYADEWNRQIALIKRFRTIKSTRPGFVTHCIIFGSLLEQSIVTCNHYSTFIVSTLVAINNTNISKSLNTTNNITNINNFIVPPAPKVYGIQSATVTAVGAFGTHRKGYVRVQFAWNAANGWGGNGEVPDESISAWIRVSQGAAGQSPYAPGDYVGIMYMPLVGSEVLVSFLNGEVDRPIVIGSVYNANNKTPKEWAFDGNCDYREGGGENREGPTKGEAKGPNETVIIRDPYGNQIKMGKLVGNVSAPCNPAVNDPVVGIEIKDSYGTDIVIDNNLGYNCTSNLGAATCGTPKELKSHPALALEWNAPDAKVFTTPNTTYTSWEQGHHGTVKSYVHGDPVDVLKGNSDNYHSGNSKSWHIGDSWDYQTGWSKSQLVGNDFSWTIGATESVTTALAVDVFVGVKVDFEASLGYAYNASAKVNINASKTWEVDIDNRTEIVARKSEESFESKRMTAKKNLSRLFPVGSAVNKAATGLALVPGAGIIGVAVLALVRAIYTKSKATNKIPTPDPTELYLDDDELKIQSSKKNFIHLLDQPGKDLTIDIKCEKKFSLESKDEVKIESDTSLDIISKNVMTIKSETQKVHVEGDKSVDMIGGNKINIEAKRAHVTVKSGANILLKPTGNATINGQKIHIG